MVRLSEQACDDWVIVGGQPCEDYAQSLLDFKPQKRWHLTPGSGTIIMIGKFGDVYG